ncbi:MAG TPA: T9SS type A sorting domain-containing protein, partial [Crocinitomicaceae bacterium]|nr:T9SS type A sorting domain-containing protein [Crocinitomicaceae bacterium]
KLRSVDNDGTYEDFNPISVKCDVKGQAWNLHPVPAETQVTIAIETDKAISDNIVVMDMNGKIVHIQAVNLEIGVNYIILDVQQFAKGTYVVKMNNETEYKPLKLMKID